jgi:SAM-dependent methyltransferase
VTETVDELTPYWEAELASLREFRSGGGGATYVDWQPTKWQSCQCLVDNALDRCAAAGGSPVSALELGCGSATISIHLAKRGLSVTAVDRVPEALELARESCVGLGLRVPPRFVLGDFLGQGLSTVPPADLVYSGGVIEHWREAGQRMVLQLHLDLSNRWVLLAVPNVDSPLFRAFIGWAKTAGRFYEDEHREISVPALAADAGCEVLLGDGCRLFLKRAAHYAQADPELQDFCAELRSRLVDAGGRRYASFPELDFTAADIDVLHAVEDAATTEERMRFGFLHYYLLDSKPQRSGGSVRDASE